MLQKLRGKKVSIWRSRQNSLSNVRTIKEEIHYKRKVGWAILTEKNLYKVTIMKEQNVYERKKIWYNWSTEYM